MSDAIKKLHDYLAKSPSVIYPEDALAYLHEIEEENAALLEELADAPKCETCESMLDCDECLRADGSHKERRRLSIENAKLRDLMYDRAHDHAIQHMTEDELRITAANALDENAKLREQSAKTLEVGTRWMAKAARFESENIKLRELVRDMMRYYFMPSAIDSKQRETELLERAHELGVEKDNGELWSEVDK